MYEEGSVFDVLLTARRQFLSLSLKAPPITGTFPQAPSAN